MDLGYDSDKANDYGCGSWRDLKIKLQGERTGRNLLDEMSDDRVGEDNCIDSEREEMHRKSKKKKKTDDRKSESETKSCRTSPRKGRTENNLSPVRRSVRANIGWYVVSILHDQPSCNIDITWPVESTLWVAQF